MVKKSFSIKGDNALGNDVSDLIKQERWPELKIEKVEESRLEWNIVVEGAHHRIDELYAAANDHAKNRHALDQLYISPMREHGSPYG